MSSANGALDGKTGLCANLCYNFYGSYVQEQRANAVPAANILRPVMWSETQKIGLGLARCGLGLAGLMSCCETRSCHAHHHNYLEGDSNFSSTIYCFSILCLEHHYCGDQQWRSLT